MSCQLECRKILLDFYSSELSTHARLIIGFSVILFTTIQLRPQGILGNADTMWWQPVIRYAGIFLSSFVLFYLFLRHLSYGQLSAAAMWTPWNTDFEKEESMKQVIEKFAVATVSFVKERRKKVLGIVPTAWFMSGNLKKGAVFCMFPLATTLTILSFLLMG